MFLFCFAIEHFFASRTRKSKICSQVYRLTQRSLFNGLTYRLDKTLENETYYFSTRPTDTNTMSPESNIIEYKCKLPSSIEKMEKDVVAFLNSDGGTIYFGIDDNGDTVEIPDIDDLQLKLKDRIKNNISQPALDYCKITIEIRNSQYIVVLTIQAGWEKPFYLNKYGMTPKGCFKRAASASEPMTAAEIETLFAKRVRNSLKNIPSSRQDLTFRQLNIYYDGKGKVLNDYFLSNLKLLTDDGKLNCAAYLLADENDNSVKFAKYADDTRADLISNEEYGCCCLVKIF